MRIGNGYDAHRLVSGRPLIIGGVNVPFEKGLDGHSDADVLTHAVMDSLLGAAALGDIGCHFPDTDMRYKNISSINLLKEVRKKLADNGYFVVNIDAVIIAQRPKLAGYIKDMAKNLASALGIDENFVSIKATTEEGLGFTGEGLGMAAFASSLIDSAL